MNNTRLFATILSLCFPILMYAQPGSPVKADIGLKIGANFASLSGDGWDNGLKTGVLGGIYGGIHTETVGAQIEFLFSNVKYDVDGKEIFMAGLGVSQVDTTKSGKVGVSTLQIPILFNVKVTGPLWLQLGPQYTSIIGLNDEENIFSDVKNVINNGDVSGVVGLVFNMGKVNVSGRYILGFSDLNASSISSAWKQKMIQLHLGLQLF